MTRITTWRVKWRFRKVGSEVHSQTDATCGSPKISVVIPCFNYGHFLIDAVSSAQQQELRPHEILVVDDGSSDSTPEVAKTLGGQIRYIRTENRGVASARNLGTVEATGDWVAFLDADDFWLPSKLSAQWTALQRSRNAIYPAIQCGFTLANSHLEPQGTSVGVARLSRKEVLLMKPQLTLVSSTLLIQRDVFLQLGGFRHDLGTSADYDLGLRLVHRDLLLSIPRSLVLYRMHGRQMHQDPRAFSRDVGKILKAELADESFVLRRRSWAAAYLLEMRLYKAAGETMNTWVSLVRSMLQWPPEVAGLLLSRAAQPRAALGKLTPNEF